MAGTSRSVEPARQCRGARAWQGADDLCGCGKTCERVRIHGLPFGKGGRGFARHSERKLNSTFHLECNAASLLGKYVEAENSPLCSLPNHNGGGCVTPALMSMAPHSPGSKPPPSPPCTETFGYPARFLLALPASSGVDFGGYVVSLLPDHFSNDRGEIPRRSPSDTPACRS
jgi:hypothetical protein